MSIPLTVVGQVFDYPVNFDENWGIEATGWAQAVTNGMLQRSGGNFPLLADANFGTSFGLVAKYLTSESANPSTSGTIRLASADPGIGFRNNANTGNLLLTTDSSDRLIYSGQLYSSGLYLKDTEVTPKTIDIIAPTTLSATWSLALPVNAGTTGQVLSTDGSGNTSWINPAGGGTVSTGTGPYLAWYATTGTTVTSNSIASISGHTLTVSNVSDHFGEIDIVGAGFSGSTATLLLQGNGSTNTIVSDQLGNLKLTDTDNTRMILLYTRSTGLVSIPNTANGVNATDATAFGQVQYGFQNALQTSNNATGSTTSTSFSGGILNGSITPTSSASRVKITITIGSVSMSSTNTGAVTIFGAGVNLVTNTGMATVGNNATDIPVHLIWIDSPATTSSITYDVQFRCISGGTMQINQNGAKNVMVLEELR